MMGLVGLGTIHNNTKTTSLSLGLSSDSECVYIYRYIVEKERRNW